MNIHRLLGKVAGFLACSAFFIARPAHADVITSFSFDSATFLNSDSGAPSTITPSFAPTDYDNTAQGTTADARDGALQLYNTNGTGTVSNQNQQITFGVNASQYKSLNVTFSSKLINSGFTTGTFQYSTDGSTFTTFNTYTNSTTYATKSFALSGITGLNLNSNAAFRIIFSGGSTTSSSASTAIDNLVVNGTLSTPEPSTYALMAIGIAVACVLMARRKRDEQVF